MGVKFAILQWLHHLPAEPPFHRTRNASGSSFVFSMSLSSLIPLISTILCSRMHFTASSLLSTTLAKESSWCLATLTTLGAAEPSEVELPPRMSFTSASCSAEEDDPTFGHQLASHFVSQYGVFFGVKERYQHSNRNPISHSYVG